VKLIRKKIATWSSMKVDKEDIEIHEANDDKPIGASASAHLRTSSRGDRKDWISDRFCKTVF
jgi:hypothetical protein